MENQSTSSTCDASRELGRKSASPFIDHLMSTPVASTKRLRKDDERVNPFERHLLNRLHEPVWSPSVLNYTSDTSMETPPTTGWEIDHIAKLNPIGIEESPSTHQNETVLDPQSEARVQAAISRFFSTNEPIAPSPISHIKNPSNDTDSSNVKGVNTDLSFPSTLPPEFEQFLYSFSNSNNGSTNASSSVTNRNIFSCVEIEAEQNSNSSQSSGGGQHPATPNAELNTSVTRRKLDFTFEMDCNEDATCDAEDCDGIVRRRHISSTDEESDVDQYPITSVILGFEHSNGRTIPSPEVDVSTVGSLGSNPVRDTLRRCVGAASTSSSTSGYASIGRSNGSLIPSPSAMETSFTGAAGTSNFKFIRSSCEEEYMSSSDSETPASNRLRLMLQSPGATPIRMQ